MKTKKHKKKRASRILLISFVAIIPGVILVMGLLFVYFKQQTILKQYKADSSILPNSLDSIRIRDLDTNEREVIVPDYHLTFSVPSELRSGQELHSSIHDENNPGTVVRLYKADTKYSKDANGYDVPDNTVIFSVDPRYGVDPLYGDHEFVQNFTSNSISSNLTSSLDFTNSMLVPRAVSFYNYYDQQHKRFNDQTTDTYRGNVRMDLLTSAHLNPTIGIAYSCYDQTSTDKDFCQKTFQLFMSSLRLSEGQLKDSPPTYEENDIFSLIPSTAENFDPSQIVYTFQHNQALPISYYLLGNNTDLSYVASQHPHEIKCMPDQMYYLSSSSNAGFAIQQGKGYVLINPKDQNILKIFQLLQSTAQKDGKISQFTTCLTDDHRYIVKYNIVPQNQEVTDIPSAQTTSARFATIDDTWKLTPVVQIPSNDAECGHILALTTDDTLYVECRTQQLVYQSFRSTIYKIDVMKKEYQVVSSCNIPVYSDGQSLQSFCK